MWLRRLWPCAWPPRRTRCARPAASHSNASFTACALLWLASSVASPFSSLASSTKRRAPSASPLSLISGSSQEMSSDSLLRCPGGRPAGEAFGERKVRIIGIQCRQPIDVNRAIRMRRLFALASIVGMSACQFAAAIAGPRANLLSNFHGAPRRIWQWHVWAGRGSEDR